MIDNFIAKSMVGMSIVGSMTMEQLPSFLTGSYDFDIKCGLFYRQFLRAPETVEELDTPVILEQLDGLKSYFRRMVQQMIDYAVKENKQEQKRDAQARMQALNKPHAMGTTAEIAAKYGLSKSEIRRRKAEGTLELLAQMEDVIQNVK